MDHDDRAGLSQPGALETLGETRLAKFLPVDLEPSISLMPRIRKGMTKLK